MERDAWARVCDKVGDGGYSALSEAERVWFNIRALIDSIEGGGVISYFYNSGADTLADCVAALDRLGAGAAKRELERVGALFPGGIPASMEARNAVIDSWDESDESIEQLLDAVDATLMPMVPDMEERLSGFLRQSTIAI